MITQSASPVQPDSTKDAHADSTRVGQKHPDTTDASHPIGEAIDKCLHRIWDIEFAARKFIPLSAKLMRREARGIRQELDEGYALIESSTKATQALGVKRIGSAQERLARLQRSDIPEVLEVSLFLSLFSAYDAFSGEFLTAIYSLKPELFSRLNRSVSVGELLGFASFEEAKHAILSAEIETFRRKSYVEQFAELEASFGIKLREFKSWPAFVEAAQRRNLMTHANGVVSEQYLSVCRKEKCDLDHKLKAGDRLELGPAYFLSRCLLIMEVVFKLGHTLWRKLLPDDLSSADTNLHRTIYRTLRNRDWALASALGEFAVGLPKTSSDIEHRISVVNYAIALKFGGRDKDSRALLAKYDWSATIHDFRLAEAVLTDDYARARELMIRIGKKSEIITEDSYHTFPLFNAFRESDEFREGYQQVYGHEYLVEVRRTVEGARIDTARVLEAKEHQAESIASGQDALPEPEVAATSTLEAAP